MGWWPFQKPYDAMKKWSFSDEINDKLQTILDMLPSFVQKTLLNMVTVLYQKAIKEYGKDYVVLIINRIIDFLKETLNGLGTDNGE